ncbi:IS630 family transposase, partial [Thorsellia kenyensis]
MKLTAEQRANLKAQHKMTHDQRICDRIRCVLLADDGWSAKSIAESQLIHETTVLRHIKDYLEDNKLKPENGGSESYLNAEQTQELITHLTQNLYQHNYQIIAYIAATYQVYFTVSGMHKWLIRHGFSYKKPKGTPHKFDVEKQNKFIETYQSLKDTVGEEPILFIDAVHPTQATKLGYGWIKKGTDKVVNTTGSRTRINLIGALNINAIEKTVVQEFETINGQSIIEFFTKLRENYPLTENKHIHIILDGAAYHRSVVVVEKALEMGIVLHYLPPYSPNLNPIERLWKIMNEKCRNNQYFPSKDKFREAVLGFFENILPTIIPE